MTWAPIDFPPKGRASLDGVRVALVKKDSTLGILFNISPMVMDTIGWTPEVYVVPVVGLDEHDGWLMLLNAKTLPPAEAERKRKLQPVLRSTMARLMMPMFPWLEHTAPIKSEVVEAKVKAGSLMVALPAWARLPKAGDDERQYPVPVPEQDQPGRAIDFVNAAKQRFGVR